MGSFEDQLWTDLEREHGPTLAFAQRAAPPRGRGRPAVLTALGAFGLVGVATALAVTLTATGASPAFAVTQNGDGSVTVTIGQIEGVTGANAELARLGVRARAVTAEPHCASTLVPVNHVIGGGALRPGPGQDAITVLPSAIPPSDTLVLVAEQVSGNRTALAAIMVNGPAPTCYGGPHWRIKATPGGSWPSTQPSRTRSASADTDSPAPTR